MNLLYSRAERDVYKFKENIYSRSKISINVNWQVGISIYHLWMDPLINLYVKEEWIVN